MRVQADLLLNLASRPARNRRFYLWARGFLILFITACVILTGYFHVRFGKERSRLRNLSSDTEHLIREAETEEGRLTAEIQNAERSGRLTVDLINSIIYQKSFSWTGFLSLLESALPDSSFITALSPDYASERTIGLKIEAVSRNLDDLVLLINNLTAEGFKGIRVESETRDGRGRLVSEISLTYERTI